MEVLVEVGPLRRFADIASRRLLRAIDGGGRSLSILDAIDPTFVGLFGNQIEILLHRFNGMRIEFKQVLATCTGTENHSGMLQHPQMLGDRLPGQPGVPGQLRN